LVDVFDEVEEQLRSDRYRTLVRTWGPWVGGVVGAVLLVLLAILGWESWQNQAAGKASVAYAAAMEAFQAGDSAKAFSSFEQVSKTGNPIYKSLALMAMGGMRLDAGEAGEAAKYFDQAAQVENEPVISDLARLKSAFALMDTAPYKDTEAKLMPLTGDKRPYRFQAKEGLGFARLLAGDTKAARRDFVALQTMLGVPDTMRERSVIAVATIDSGAAKNLPAIVKQAIATPAPQQLPGDAQLPPQAQ
jgi:hypothetical protein